MLVLLLTARCRHSGPLPFLNAAALRRLTVRLVGALPVVTVERSTCLLLATLHTRDNFVLFYFSSCFYEWELSAGAEIVILLYFGKEQLAFQFFLSLPAFPLHLSSCSENLTNLCPSFSLHERVPLLPCPTACAFKPALLSRELDLGPGDVRLNAAHQPLSRFETFQSISCE